MKRILLVTSAGLLYHTGLVWLRRLFRRYILRRREVCVLALHRVLSPAEETNTNSLSGMILREATFAKVLEFLVSHFDVIPLDDFVAGLRTNRRDGKPQCLITFDDGWRDNYSTAYPWLKKYSVPAAIFVSTGMMETREAFWAEEMSKAWRDPAKRLGIQSSMQALMKSKNRLPELEETVEYCKRRSAEKRRHLLEAIRVSTLRSNEDSSADQTLTWEQAKEMSQDLVAFGSHTVLHPLLTYENDEVIRRELEMSRQVLEQNLGKEVVGFAYPNGDWNGRVREMVKEAGYRAAFTTERRWFCCNDDPFAIPRIMLHEGNVTGLDGSFSAAVLSLRLF